jgi:predicted O-methyltransferase YrrM
MLKAFLARQVDRVAGHVLRGYVERIQTAPAFDIVQVAKASAALQSAEYFEEHLLGSGRYADKLDLLRHAAALAPSEGLVLEFGVASGRTISHLAGWLPDRQIYGFDSFDGLPEDWWVPKGTFAQTVPDVPDNVELVVGLFADTLPSYAATHQEPIALAHVDCDLYSSTRTVFDALEERIVRGTVMVFDEYWNYPGWRAHEHRALQEFVIRTGRSYRYDSFVPASQQVCIVFN